MKNWFDNLSINKQRFIAILLLILGLIILIVAFDNLVLLIFAIPLFLIGSALLFYIDKKEKNKKKANQKHKEAYCISYEKQDDFSNKVKEAFSERYVIPDGKEVSDYRIVETRVRGVFYNDIYDYEIRNNDSIAIKHNPNPDYPESTEVILISDGAVLGYLMKEMALEFVEKYGEKFCFIGKIISYEKEEDDDEGKIGKIIIQFKAPKFKKSKGS